MKQFLAFFTILCGISYGQSIIAPASTVNGVPATNLITVCNTNPGSGTCGSLVGTFTTIATSVSCSGTNGPLSGAGCSNPGYSDQAGNIVAFAAAGQYWCQYKASSSAVAYSLPCSATGGGSGGTPGGSNTQIQFNNSSAFGGDANLTWNNTTKQFQYGTSVGPSTFSIASNAYITGFPLNSFFNTTTDGTSTVNGPLAIPNNFSMDINPATGSQTTEAWTLNALAYTDSANSSNFTNELVGMHSEFDHRGSGLVTNGYALSGEDFLIGGGGMTFETGVLGNSGTWTGSTGNVNTAQAFVGLIWNAGSGVITNGYGMHIFAHTTGGATGTITNMTGLQIDDINVTGVTNPLAINVAANDSNLGPGHVKMGIAQLTAAANDSAPPLSFQAGGFTSNVPGCEANGLATSSAILYCVINGVKLTALDFSFGQTMVNQSGLGFASSGLSRNSGFFPLGASAVAIGNGTASDTSGILVGNHGVKLTATAALTAGQIVKIDTSTNNSVVVTTTADTGGGIVSGIVLNSPGAGGNAFVVTTGLVTTPILGTGTCTVGQFVIVDTTTNGRVKCTSTYTAGTVIGQVTTGSVTVGNAISVLVGLR